MKNSEEISFDGVRIKEHNQPITIDIGWGAFNDDGEYHFEKVGANLTKINFAKENATQLILGSNYNHYKNGFFVKFAEKPIYFLNHAELNYDILKVLSLEYLFGVEKNEINLDSLKQHLIKTFENEEKGKEILSLIEKHTPNYQAVFSTQEALQELKHFDFNEEFSILLSEQGEYDFEFPLKDMHLDILLFMAILTQKVFLNTIE